MPITTIIFDLGGVILNLDYNKTIEAFRALGARNIEKVYNPEVHFQSPLFDQFELNDIPSEQFRAGVKQALEITDVTDDEFDSAWNAMLLDIPQNRLDTIRTLRDKGYNVLLFSNTNQIHFDALSRTLMREDRFDLFPAYFNNEYYSFIYRKKKPEPDSFLKILRENKATPKETLFIDDTLGNIQGAQQAGLYTFYFTRGRTFSDVLIQLRDLEIDIAQREREETKKDNSCKCVLM